MEKLESTLERNTRTDHSRRLEGTASGLSRKLTRSLSEMLGHELPGGVEVLFDGNGTKSCGCNEAGQVQADRWVVRNEEALGYVWFKSLPSLRCDSWCRRRTQMLVCFCC